MTATETTEREPTDEELAEYLEDPYAQELTILANRLTVLSNAIDFELPEEVEEEIPEGAELATGSIPLSTGPKSDEARYLQALSLALSQVESAIHLRTRICFRHFPYDEHKTAAPKKKPRKKQ